MSEAFTGSKTPLPNPYCSPIPPLAFDTFGSVKNMPAVLTALKQDVESLIGVRGDQPNRAVTFKDLIDFGILSGEAVGSPNGLGGGQGPPGPPGTSIPLPVAIASGGTGAVTAPAALTNLGAVAKAGDTMTGELRINVSAYPKLIINSTSNGADLKKWQSYVMPTGDFRIAALNDAENAELGGVTFNRSGGILLQPTANYATITLNKPAGAFASQILGNRDGVGRWLLRLGSDDAESGSNTGSDWTVHRATDAGAYTEVMRIRRDTGNVMFANTLFVPWIKTGLATSGNGTIGFAPGTTSTVGYIEWFLPNGTRQAYMGYHQSYLLLNLDQGGHLRVQGGGNAGIQFNNTAQTTSFALFDDGNSHIESTTSLWLNYNGNGVRTQGNFYIDNGKALYMNGYRTLYADANYAVLYDTAGNAALFLGGGSDRTNYYRNTIHNFGDIGGGNVYFRINTGTPAIEALTDIHLKYNLSSGGKDYSKAIFFDQTWEQPIYIRGNLQPGVLAMMEFIVGTGFMLLYNTGQMTIGAQGFKPGGGTWADSSDIRTKEDIADYTASLDAVARLRPVTFKHNGRGGSIRDGKIYVGLIADEVQDIMPEMVSSTIQKLDPDDIENADILALDATPMLYAFVNAFKEVKQRLEILEAKQ